MAELQENTPYDDVFKTQKNRMSEIINTGN